MFNCPVCFRPSVTKENTSTIFQYGMCQSCLGHAEASMEKERVGMDHYCEGCKGYVQEETVEIESMDHTVRYCKFHMEQFKAKYSV